MQVLIVGAGNAGRRLAEKLCDEKHDVVVVDHSQDALDALSARLDVMTVRGHGSSPVVLEQAQIRKAGLIVAVTSHDETNILACLQASQLGVAHRIARIFNRDYLQKEGSFDLNLSGVEMAVSPHEQCARDIYNQLQFPGAQEIVEVLENRVIAIGIEVSAVSPLIAAPLKDLVHPEILDTVRFVALMRDEVFSIPFGTTQFVPGDRAYVVGEPGPIRRFLDWVCPVKAAVDKVVIAGGSGIGLSLAKMLEHDRLDVVLIEQDKERSIECSARLKRALVIHGNALERETLENAGITTRTAFVAATGDDENNIIDCLLARKQGAVLTVAQVGEPEYVPIIEGLGILDQAVSTHLSVINAIMQFIRGKNVRAVSLLHTMPGELLEIDLSEHSRWAGKAIQKIRLPRDSIIATVLRDQQILPATGNLQLQAGDRLVIFSSPHAIGKLRSICGG